MLLRTPKLLPLPKKSDWGNGFLDWSKAEFSLDEQGLPQGDFLSIEKKSDSVPSGSYKLSITENGIEIFVSDDAGSRLALSTLRQIGMQADSRGFRFCELSDYPNVAIRTFSLDLSHGKIPTLENIKLLVDLLSLFKYNRLELCLTNAYPFEGRENEWALSAVLSSNKILRLKNYCSSQGIELSLAFDAIAYGVADTIKVAENFDCCDINIGGAGASVDDIVSATKSLAQAGYNPMYVADAFVEANGEIDISKLPKGVAIFSDKLSRVLCDVCKKMKDANKDFILSADVSSVGFPNYCVSRSKVESVFSKFAESGAYGFTANFVLGEFSQVCTFYFPLALSASAMWSSLSTDEAVCEALDSFVFYDAVGDFSRSLLSFGNVVKSELIFDMFFASENKIEKIISENCDVDFDVLESSADFAMSLAATAKMESRDSRILSAELALIGAMMKWAVNRTRKDVDVTAQEVMLKFIIADFENVWLARCECGGLWSTSAKLRSIKSYIF